MIRNVLEHIGGISAYGVISICLFFIVFLAVVIRALCLKKSHVDSMSALPLDDATPSKTNDNSNP